MQFSFTVDARISNDPQFYRLYADFLEELSEERNDERSSLKSGTNLEELSEERNDERSSLKSGTNLEELREERNDERSSLKSGTNLEELREERNDERSSLKSGTNLEEINKLSKSSPESRGERLCKAAEKIYGVTFQRFVRPPWLVNPETGCQMQFDLYNEELKLAIEFHGRQHYQYVPLFHRKGREDFQAQLRRDERKLDICDEKGVYVIVVPPLPA